MINNVIIGKGNGLAPSGKRIITYKNDDLVLRRLYASLDLNKLTI